MPKAMDSREWMSLYVEVDDDLKRYISEIQGHGSSGVPVKNKRMIEKKLNRIQADCDKLVEALAEYERDPTGYRIGAGEIKRRSSKLSLVQAALQNAYDALSGESRYGGTSFTSQKLKDTEETRGLSNQELYQTQIKAKMEADDEKLDQISAGVDKLLHISNDINKELGLHDRLLDDIGDGVATANDKMEYNVRGVDHVSRKEKNCCSLVIIFVLLLLIVAVIAIPMKTLCSVFNSDKCHARGYT